VAEFCGVFNERVSLVDEPAAHIAYGTKICRCLCLHIELNFDFEVPEELVDLHFLRGQTTLGFMGRKFSFPGTELLRCLSLSTYFPIARLCAWL
jgi:hypothetical protein